VALGLEVLQPLELGLGAGRRVVDVALDAERAAPEHEADHEQRAARGHADLLPPAARRAVARRPIDPRGLARPAGGPAPTPGRRPVGVVVIAGGGSCGPAGTWFVAGGVVIGFGSDGGAVVVVVGGGGAGVVVVLPAAGPTVGAGGLGSGGGGAGATLPVRDVN